MADAATPAKPGFDPAPILDKLKGMVEAKTSGGSMGAIDTLVVLAVVLATTAIWAYISSRNNAELAKLRHEKEVQRITAEKAAVDAKVAVNDAAIAAAQKQMVAANEQIAHIEADIRAEDQRYAANLRAVDRIHSWRDLVGSGGPDAGAR